MNRIQTKVRGRWFVSTMQIHRDLMPPWDRRFETCLLDTINPYGWRKVAHYPTPDAARRGHNRIVKQIRGGDIPKPID